jgi:hypothetical protein
MTSCRHVTLIIGGIWLIAGPLADAQNAAPSTAELVDRVCSGHSDTVTYYACKVLGNRLRAADADQAGVVIDELVTRLSSADSAGVVWRTAWIIASRPTAAAIAAMVGKFEGADRATQEALCMPLQSALNRLPPAERKALAPSIVPRMLALVKTAPKQSRKLGCEATWCLGALRGDGFPALMEIMNNPVLRTCVADALPSALAETTDARALDPLVALYDMERLRDPEKRCLTAMGALIYALKKARTPVPDAAYQAAIDRIHEALRSDDDPQLLAAAIRAGGAAVGVDNDELLRQAALAALGHENRYPRVGALEVLLGSRTSRLPEVRSALQRLADTEKDPNVRSDVEAVIGAAAEADE